MFVRSFHELVTYFNETKIPHRVDAEHQVLALHSVTPPTRSDLVVKWETRVPFITMRLTVIADIPPNRLREVETAVVRLNDNLDVPGFNLSHTQRHLYYKGCVPVFDEGVNPEMLGRVGAGIVNNVIEFGDVFRAVVDGKPGADIAKLYDAQVYLRRTASPFI